MLSDQTEAGGEKVRGELPRARRRSNANGCELAEIFPCIYGGSPMPEALMLQVVKRLPSWRFYQIYGMTETGGFARMLRWRDQIASGPEAAGLQL